MEGRSPASQEGGFALGLEESRRWKAQVKAMQAEDWPVVWPAEPEAQPGTLVSALGGTRLSDSCIHGTWGVVSVTLSIRAAHKLKKKGLETQRWDTTYKPV